MIGANLVLATMFILASTHSDAKRLAANQTIEGKEGVAYGQRSKLA